MIKGASIALFCLFLGTYLGHFGTVKYYEMIVETLVKTHPQQKVNN